jgi:iron complex transport system permease protein
VSGVIGFVGLIIPHTIRLIAGSDNRVVLPFSAVGGGIFLILCDTIARMPTSELPVGVLTSMFGAPYFISILLRNKRKVV